MKEIIKYDENLMIFNIKKSNQNLKLLFKLYAKYEKFIT